MDVQTTWNRIEALPGLLYKLSKKEPEAVSELSELLFDVTGERLLRTCGDCINKAYQKITNLSIEKLQAMKDQKYKLKEPGNPIYFNHTHYTGANMTDEVAKEMIASNKANADLFDIPTEPKKETAKADNKD